MSLLRSPIPPNLSTREGPAVELVGLRKEFRRRARRSTTRRSNSLKPRSRTVVAIDGISLSIARGETVAILGQNGSGKSTLVRLLSTLLLNDGGSATVFGHDVFADAQAVRRLVNRVSVEASFFKKMSATENLSYAARFYGMSPRETREEIPRILDRVGFPAVRAAESMENLSRGMQQKVALARALLTAPVLLLLDEPTTGLDPRSKREVQTFIREVRAVHDATIMLCTHDLVEAEMLADRIGIIDRGRLLHMNTTAGLIQHYGVASLEEAFFAASGRDLGEDDDECDDDTELEVCE